LLRIGRDILPILSSRSSSFAAVFSAFFSLDSTSAPFLPPSPAAMFHQYPGERGLSNPPNHQLSRTPACHIFCKRPHRLPLSSRENMHAASRTAFFLVDISLPPFSFHA